MVDFPLTDYEPPHLESCDGSKSNVNNNTNTNGNNESNDNNDNNDKDNNSNNNDCKNSDNNNKDQSHKYDLYAIANHMGILGGGHYICYAKHKNGNWYIYLCIH